MRSNEDVLIEIMKSKDYIDYVSTHAPMILAVIGKNNDVIKSLYNVDTNTKDYVYTCIARIFLKHKRDCSPISRSIIEKACFYEALDKMKHEFKQNSKFIVEVENEGSVASIFDFVVDPIKTDEQIRKNYYRAKYEYVSSVAKSIGIDINELMTAIVDNGKQTTRTKYLLKKLRNELNIVTTYGLH